MEETKKITRTDFFKAIGYEPHEGQKAVHESGARYRIVTCGRRGGKSEMLAAEAALFLVAGGRVLVTAVIERFRTQLIDRIIEDLDRARPLVGERANLKWLTDRGAALDAGVPNFSLSGSKGYDLVVSKEISRATENPVKIILSLVLEREGHWLEAGTAQVNAPLWYRRLVTKAAEAGGEWARFAWASNANPSLPGDFMETMKEGMLGDIAKAELSGEIVTTQSKSQD